MERSLIKNSRWMICIIQNQYQHLFIFSFSSNMCNRWRYTNIHHQFSSCIWYSWCNSLVTGMVVSLFYPSSFDDTFSVLVNISGRMSDCIQMHDTWNVSYLFNWIDLTKITFVLLLYLFHYWLLVDLRGLNMIFNWYLNMNV